MLSKVLIFNASWFCKESQWWLLFTILFEGEAFKKKEAEKVEFEVGYTTSAKLFGSEQWAVWIFSLFHSLWNS